MTICIAAICSLIDSNEEAIICVSDCMLTVENVEFETSRSKICRLNDRTSILFAGDVIDHTMISRDAFLGKNTDSMTTAQIADAYAEAFQGLRMKRAEAKILKPQGLTLKTYVSQQRKLSDAFIDDIRPRLAACSLEFDAIVAGRDSTGAHIFTIQDPGVAYCHDDVSFCGIGIGAEQAQDQFMFSSYTKGWTFPSALNLVYYAKRRAERTAGVGTETIMTTIGPGGAHMLHDNCVKFLQSMYEETNAQIKQIYEEARTKIWDEVNKWGIF